MESEWDITWNERTILVSTECVQKKKANVSMRIVLSGSLDWRLRRRRRRNGLEKERPDMALKLIGSICVFSVCIVCATVPNAIVHFDSQQFGLLGNAQKTI